MALTRLARAKITGGLTVTFGSVAYACGLAVGEATGALKVAVAVGGVIATTLTGGIPTYEQWKQVQERRVAEKLAIETQEELRVAVGDVLEPLTAQLAKIHTAQGSIKKGLQGEAVQMVLNAAAGLTGAGRTRACFFTLDAGSPDMLRPDKWAGRSGQPHRRFERGTAAGDAVFAMLEERGRRFYRDVEVDPPPGWQGTASGYRSFVAVAVHAGDQCYGMLTVDALRPGDLNADEPGLVDVFAHLLGVALSA